jgi:TRAP-type C4-dicarboxylate transport system permease small subunit
MNRFWQALEWLTTKMKVVGAACLLGMTALTCIDVAGRFFGHPLFGSVELVGFMAVLAVAMALPYTHKVDGHIGVEIVVRLLPQRARLVIDIATGVACLLLSVVVAWRMGLYARTLQESGEVSMNLELPEYAVVYVVAFSMLVLSVVIVQSLVAKLRRLLNR